ncbi:MAG: histidinol-phosphatase [Hyphomicrobiales bacterium]|jgi:histidinol phosphatase-like enzyme (inositol monophosphatase family)
MTDPTHIAITARSALFDEMQAIAKRETLPFFRTAMTIDNKRADSGGFDPVTEGDRNCEAALRALIETHFPDDGILGEEFGNVRLSAPFVWVIDPIDGTRAFVAGVPLWGMLVGLMHQGAPVAGLAHQPFIDEAFSASGNGSALWSKSGQTRPMVTRSMNQLSQATLMTTTPALFNHKERAAYDDVEAKTRSVRYGTDWYSYALIACGTADIVVESGLSSYDILPLVPIIEAAGGAVTDWRGKPLSSVNEAFAGQVLAVGDKALIPEATDLLAPAAH